MRLKSPDGKVSYLVTPEDTLWLLRAVAAEGEPEGLVAQTLVNGFVWARAQTKFRGTLGDWVRAYAQPVNPRHFVTGDLFKKAHPNPSAEDLARAARRERYHSTRTVFEAGTKEAVRGALQGSPSLVNATDYAAAWVDATSKGYRPLTGAVKGRNRFWVRPGAFGWTGYVVEGGITPGRASLALLLAALAFAILRA